MTKNQFNALFSHLSNSDPFSTQMETSSRQLMHIVCHKNNTYLVTQESKLFCPNIKIGYQVNPETENVNILNSLEKRKNVTTFISGLIFVPHNLLGPALVMNRNGLIQESFYIDGEFLEPDYFYSDPRVVEALKKENLIKKIRRL